MNLLLDSHAFLWFTWDDPKLSPTAKALIEDPANRKLVSVATCWEIAIKVGLKSSPRRTGRDFLASNSRRTRLACWESSWRTRRSWSLCLYTTKTRSTACWSPRQRSRNFRSSVPT